MISLLFYFYSKFNPNSQIHQSDITKVSPNSSRIRKDTFFNQVKESNKSKNFLWLRKANNINQGRIILNQEKFIDMPKNIILMI